MKDHCGNEFEVETKREGNTIIQTTRYKLEQEKTTLRGEHPKLENDINCIHPDRLSCNYGVGFERCECMTYMRDPYNGCRGNWRCIQKVQPKGKRHTKSKVGGL